MMDLITIVAIAAPISSAAIVGTIALVKFARRFGSIEQSIKLIAKENEAVMQNNKSIHSQLNKIEKKVVRIETILNGNMEGD